MARCGASEDLDLAPDSPGQYMPDSPEGDSPSPENITIRRKSQEDSERIAFGAMKGKALNGFS